MNRFFLFWLLFIVGFGAVPSFANDKDALCFAENTADQLELTFDEEPTFKSNRLLFPPSGIPSLRVTYCAAHHLHLRKAHCFAIAELPSATLYATYLGCLRRTLVQTVSVLSYHPESSFSYHTILSIFCIWRK